MNRPSIDLERLASLLDGRLKEPERSELLVRLARSPDDLELLADIVAISPERATSGSSARPVDIRTPRRPWRIPPRYLAAAALILGIVVVPTMYMRTERSPAVFPPAWNYTPWGGSRGEDAFVSSAGRSWRVGARLTDLAVSIRAHHDASAATFATDIARALADVPAAGPAVAIFQDIAARAISDPKRAAELAREGRDAARALLDSNVVDLGEWTEAARLAAHRNDAAFFRSRHSDAMLANLGRGPHARVEADSIRSALKAALATPSNATWLALEQALESLLSRAAR